MTKENKELLLCDLCERLRYGVKLKIGEYSDYELYGIIPNREQELIVRLFENGTICNIDISVENAKPYLRPMSSMTEEEIDTLWNIWENDAASEAASQITDFLNKKYLDHHHLIEKCLALEAPEGMYK